MPPLFVIEFLHRVVDTFTEYFNSCTETSIKEHIVIVFEVRIIGLFHGFDSRESGPALCPRRVHCVVFLGKTLYSHGASLHPGV